MKTKIPTAFEQLLALSENSLTNETDLLIWPESAVPEFDDASYAAITNLIRAHHVWLMLNADDAVPRPNATNEYDNDVFNAAFLLDPAGSFARHLSQTKARHLRRIHSARALAAVPEMVHAHHRRLTRREMNRSNLKSIGGARTPREPDH